MATISSAPCFLGYYYDWCYSDVKYLSDEEQKRFNDYVDPVKANKRLVMTELYNRREAS